MDLIPFVRRPFCAASPARRSRLALALAPLLAGAVALAPSAVFAQQSTAPNQAELDRTISEGRKSNTVIPTPGTLLMRRKDGPRLIEADEISGINQKSLSARGSVVLRQDSIEVFAERIDYDQETDTAFAPGTLRLKRDGDTITGSNLKLRIDAEVGTLLAPTFFFGKSPTRPTQRYEARGAADSMDFEGPDKERLFGASYTTCKVGEEDWFLRVSELSLDRASNIGTGYNGRIVFKGVPILYVPYMNFPLNNERKSGLLTPTFGSSSNSGLELAVPFYWNIAPNHDATITPKIFSKRGVQIGSEVRYLGKQYIGQFDAEYLPNDRKADSDRYLLSLRHYQNLEGVFGSLVGNGLTRGWSGSINAQKVSDDAYFRDLSTRIANTAQTNLPRDFALNYNSDFGNLSARHLSFQTLQDPLAPVVTPYRLAPQITFNARPARVQGFEFNTTGELTEFLHPTLVNGRRLLLYPSIAYSITKPYGYLTPKIGYHLTRYDLTQNTIGYASQTRSLPILSLDSGLAFERPTTFGGQGYTQTLEPRLFFLYVPYREQSTIPIFSTSETDFNFSQIFSDNLFIGGDRISDSKQLTAAVTTRFIENLTGIERLRAAIGQRYSYQTQRVSLSNSNTLAASGTAGSVGRSDLLAAVSGQVSDQWFLDSSFQYGASQNQFQKSNVAARYHGDGGRIFNISYRFTRDSLKQIDISTQWPFGRMAPGWTLLARANHSLSDRRLIEALFGVEYNKGCWEFRLVAHRFATATQQYSNSIQFQLELKGLSKLGINPFETLKQNIVGYKRSDDRDYDPVR